MAKQDPKCPKCNHPKSRYNERDAMCQFQVDDESICGCYCAWNVKKVKRRRKGR